MRKSVTMLLLGFTAVAWLTAHCPHIEHLVEDLWAFDTLTRATLWNTGDVLTAPALNEEFDNAIQGINNIINDLEDSSDVWVNRSVDSTRTISVYDLNWPSWKLRWSLGASSVDSATAGDSASVYVVSLDKSYISEGYSSLLFENDLGVTEELWINTYEEMVPHYSEAVDSLIFLMWAESTDSNDNSVSVYLRKVGQEGAVDSSLNLVPISSRSSRLIKLSSLDSLYAGEDIRVSFKVRSTSTDTIFLSRVELYGH